MIMHNEIGSCINGKLSPEDERVIVEHYRLGGFNPNVLPSLRSEFVQWIDHVYAETHPTTPPSDSPEVIENQLDLFGNSEHKSQLINSENCVSFV